MPPCCHGLVIVSLPRFGQGLEVCRLKLGHGPEVEVEACSKADAPLAVAALLHLASRFSSRQ